MESILAWHPAAPGLILLIKKCLENSNYFFYSILKVNLGNGLVETNMEIAEGKFIAQNFPQLWKCDEKPHNIIMAPPAFLFKEWTEKVNIFYALITFSNYIIFVVTL